MQTFVCNCLFLLHSGGEKKSTAAPLSFSLLRNKSRGLKVSVCIKKAGCTANSAFLCCILLSKGCQTVWCALLHLHKEKTSPRSPSSFSSLSYSHTYSLCVRASASPCVRLCVYTNTTWVFLCLLPFFAINSNHQASLAESDDRLGRGRGG